MARITVDDCLKTHPQSLRAHARRDLPRAPADQGASPLIDTNKDKPTVIALREIAAQQGRHRDPQQGPGLSGAAAAHVIATTRFSQAATGSMNACWHNRGLEATDHVRGRASVPRRLQLSEAGGLAQLRTRLRVPRSRPRRPVPHAPASPTSPTRSRLPSILTQWHLDSQALTAALLHDVMEDTTVTKSEISEQLRQAWWPSWWTGSPSSTRSSSRARSRPRRRTSARCCWPWRATCA